MKTLFVDQLTVIDFSYLNSSRGLLGESWLVDCELSGELNDEGMLFDFGHVKKFIKEFIDTYADHKLIIATQTDNLTISDLGDGQTEIEWQNGQRYLSTSAPEDAFLFLEDKEVTTESLTELLETWIKTLLPENVKGIKLHLYCENLAGSFYHYSHGLKKHEGNCQRIAHGHRSPIEIYENQQRSAELEQVWAEKFKDIYIGTREDIAATTSKNQVSCTKFSYQAPQGHFELSINSDQVYLIDTDSTVEWIADHIAQQLKKETPSNTYKVKAFEGYRKGAIAEY
ncbi:6-pyruvoyl trahydropterin synthase family protein [Litoribacillus peritrichatus]|uniref:6-carboxy-5,6,7,8-tetrahydropterin synthase n=1 Tax=Litoribacillus peritrichatus TaxID=718191 RepID=A0ABP7M492_9GAMM